MARLYFALTVLLLSVSFQFSEARGKFCSKRPPGLYADPKNKRRYYLCDRYSLYGARLSCARGRHFDASVKKCVLDSTSTTATTTPTTTFSGTTTPSTTTTTSPTTTTSSTTTPSTTLPMVADFCGGKSNGFYADRRNCSRFYVCTPVYMFHKTCPANTKWDSSTKSCKEAEKVNCFT